MTASAQFILSRWDHGEITSAPAPTARGSAKSTARSEESIPLWQALAFALKTYAAAILALFFAFWLGLDEPRWALLTVFIVSQPESGLVLAKGFYRALGTAAGLLVAAALIFAFSQYGGLFLASLAIWIALCCFAARATRNFAAYGWMLGGYTVAIVGIPGALDPNSAYPLIVARGTEIALGIGCAALFSRLVLFQDLGKTLVSRVLRAIEDAKRLSFAIGNPDCDEASLTTDRIALIQSLAEAEGARGSAYFESVDARHLDRPIQGAIMASLTACAIADRTASRARGVASTKLVKLRCTPASRALVKLSPAENGALVSQLISAANLSAAKELEMRLSSARAAIVGKCSEHWQTEPQKIWFDPFPSALTGIRAALAVAITSVFWIATSWPSGPIAIVVAAVVCSLIATMPQPTKITVALAAIIVASGVPIFVTVFYLLPLASDFVSMALVVAPLMLTCAFIMAQPKVGSAGLLCAVYFSVGSNIDNVTQYDTAQFFNTSLGILFGIGVALVLFATFFPETPSQALWLLRRQLLYRLSRLASDRAGTFVSFAYAFSDATATTLGRAKDEPASIERARQMALAALSIAYAIERLKRIHDVARIPPSTKNRVDILLNGISKAFTTASRSALTRRAWELRALRRDLLQQALVSRDGETEAVGHALAGCETLRANLTTAQLGLVGTPHVR